VIGGDMTKRSKIAVILLSLLVCICGCAKKRMPDINSFEVHNIIRNYESRFVKEDIFIFWAKMNAIGQLRKSGIIVSAKDLEGENLNTYCKDHNLPEPSYKAWNAHRFDNERLRKF
jgi:hypothetical protein